MVNDCSALRDCAAFLYFSDVFRLDNAELGVTGNRIAEKSPCAPFGCDAIAYGHLHAACLYDKDITSLWARGIQVTTCDAMSP